MSIALSCPSYMHIPRKLLPIAALTLVLQACSGGGGGGGDGGGSDNGLHADLQECAYLLDVLTAQQINDGGACVYELADGTTGVATIGGGAVTLVPVVDGNPVADDDPVVDDTPIVDDVLVVDDTPIDMDALVGDVPRNLALADAAGSDFYPDPNNTAILSGALIGDGSVDNSMITRSVPFQVGVLAPQISVEHVYAVRSSATRTTLLTVIKNISDQPQCFVDSTEVAVIDQQNGSVLPFFDGAFVEGTLFQLNSGIVTNTCLDPDQLAYVPKQFDMVLADVKAYSIGDISTLESSNADKMLSKIVPISYEVLANGDIEVLVANQGLTSVQLSTGYTVLLDNDGFPLAFGYGFSEEELNPGAEAVISVRFGSFEGIATSVRMIVDADPIE